MPLTLQDTYNYLFRNDWADPEYGLSAKLTPELRKKKIAERQAKMKSLFEKIINPDEREKFRSLLRFIKASHLETAMFGNNTDKIEEKYIFPNNAKILAQLNMQDSKYHYFETAGNLETKEEKSNQKFLAFFHISKIIGDFIEHNNSADDENAALHAYKLLVLFGTSDKSENYFKSIDTYLKTHNYFEVEKSLHDALVWPIPVNSSTTHASQWSKIIQETGTKAFQLFTRAPAIGEALKHPPSNYTEALITARNIAYKRSTENPELATLCMHYNLDEKNYNKALDIKPKTKKFDNLPTIVINGADVGRPRYYLLKLPINDPRAFVLGHITNCCQSIGGHSETCVIDGITRPNNGFLVLVKERLRAEDSKEEKEPHTILTEKDIDIKAILVRSKIMGQGYCWISQLGNLTIDSWENLNPSAEDPVIIDILSQYAADVVNQPKSQIVRVTVGCGGKTPADFSKLVKETNCPEKILEGIQYGDSVKQYSLSVNKEFSSELAEQLKKNYPLFSKEKIDLLTDIDRNYTSLIKSVLQTESLMKWLTDDALFEKFLTLLKKIESNAWHILILLDKEKLLTEGNIDGILNIKENFLTWFDTILSALKKADILNQNTLNFILFYQYPEPKKDRLFDDGKKLAEAFSNFLTTLVNANALTPQTLRVAFSHINNPFKAASMLSELQESNIPISDKAFIFVHEYCQNPAEAKRILTELTGKTLPNIYQHFENRANKQLSSTNYQEILKELQPSISLLQDAYCTLIAYLANPATIDYGSVVIRSTENGNFNLLNLFFNMCPPEVEIKLKIRNNNQVMDFLCSTLNKYNTETIRDELNNSISWDSVQNALSDFTILMLLAAKTGEIDIVDFYLKKGADPNFALKLAIQFDLIPAVDLLLNKVKVNPNNIAFFQLACRYQRTPKSLDLLIEAKADLNSLHVLHFAAKSDQPIFVEKLLEKKANIDEPHPDDENTLLASVVQNALADEHAEKMINLLLEAKANADCVVHNHGASTPILHLALRNYNPQMIRSLVTHGAKMDVVDAQGRTVLQYAINDGSGWAQPSVLIKELLDLGAPSDLTRYQDISKSTLYQSCVDERAKQLLIEFHAEYMKKNPSPFSESSNTPLFFSERKNAPEPAQADQTQKNVRKPPEQLR